MTTITAIDHLVLTVQDIPRTIAFYDVALGLTAETFTVADGTVRTALVFGQQKINLHAADAPFKPHANHPCAGSADICFRTETPLKDWMDHLRLQDIPVIDGPVARTGAQGPITSIYLRDPDLNLIEIAIYG